MKNEMVTRNIFFNFAGRGHVEGIRRTGRKIDNFKLVVPLFKAKKVWLPTELKTDQLVVEILEEFRYATSEEFKSKHDDTSDAISMILEIEAFKPSANDKSTFTDSESGRFAWYEEDDDDMYKNSTVF
jgi:phage terminase large subunit-like protein